MFILRRINKAIKKQKNVKDGNVTAYFWFSQFGCDHTWSCLCQRNPALAMPSCRRILHQDKTSMSQHSLIFLKQTFQRLESFFSGGERQLTHWCVKSNVLLIRVEIFVLLPAELTDVAPGFCGQGKQAMRHCCPQRRQLLKEINEESTWFDLVVFIWQEGTQRCPLTLKRKTEIERL